jgi:hypothetical protein
MRSTTWFLVALTLLGGCQHDVPPPARSRPSPRCAARPATPTFA